MKYKKILYFLRNFFSDEINCENVDADLNMNLKVSKDMPRIVQGRWTKQ